MRHRSLFGMAAVLIVAGALVHPLRAQSRIIASVVRVMDGDTLQVIVNDHEQFIRLYGMDCPEANQAFGTEATAFTKSVAWGKGVVLIPHSNDRDLMVAEVRLPTGESLGELLTAAGLAWWDQRLAPELTQLGLAEVKARAAQSGLWSQASQIPPWVFRLSAHPANINVYRPSSQDWAIFRDGQPPLQIHFGAPGDLPVPADYLGHGSAQIAVFQPSTAKWFIRDDDGTSAVTQFGTTGDVPVPGDYDGTGRTRIAVYRPSNQTWYIRRDDGKADTVRFGQAGDVPVPAPIPNE